MTNIHHYIAAGWITVIVVLITAFIILTSPSAEDQLRRCKMYLAETTDRDIETIKEICEAK
jgi:hypothetical protein